MSFKELIIDLDIPVYRAALRGQKTTYDLKNSEGELVQNFRSAKDCKSYLLDAKDMFDEDTSLWTRETVVTILDVDECFKALDRTIESYLTVTKIPKGLYSIGGDSSGNFRNSIATLNKYKDRTGDKPHYLKEVKAYAIQKYNPTICTWKESDDQISEWLYEDYLKGLKLKDKTLCSRVMLDLEKDCRVTAGWHFDPKVDKEPIWISTLEANSWLFAMALAGDSADTYYGCHGIGYVKAKKLLEGSKSTRELYDRSLGMFKSKFGDSHQYESWDGLQMIKTPAEVLEENLRLALMLRQGDPEKDYLPLVRFKTKA